jgi:predicted ATP-grasp superfamily ATP-dependent carboligase
VTRFDADLPLIVLKVGRYPRDHSAVGAIRSLGRVGIPVYAITEDRFTPAAVSRFLTRPIVAPTSGLEAESVLLERLADAARRIGRPALALPTDDEAALLVGEHRAELAPWLLSPSIDPTLPRRLASKRGLRELCLEHGVATPETSFAATFAEVEAFSTRATFPVIAKVVNPWERLRSPAVRDARMIRSAEELVSVAATWANPEYVMLQEYLPQDSSEDWIFHGYFDEQSECLAGFTGVKYRSWPPYFGATSYGRVVTNARLFEDSTSFCARLGFRGIIDMDWRLDRRDGRYRLLDCNPRVGAQFRLFENDAGIDVVRALHLDLSGRKVPRGRQIDGRGFVVENRDLPAIFGYRRVRRAPTSVPHAKGRVEFAWFAWDDPLPFVAMTARLAGKHARGAVRRVTSRDQK